MTTTRKEQFSIENGPSTEDMATLCPVALSQPETVVGGLGKGPVTITLSISSFTTGNKHTVDVQLLQLTALYGREYLLVGRFRTATRPVGFAELCYFNCIYSFETKTGVLTAEQN